MITWSLLYLVSEWIIRLVMLFVVTHRRRPVAALAWLLVISFLPWFGLFLYLLIGENRLPRKRVAEHRAMLAELERRDGRLHPFSPSGGADAREEHRDLIALAEQLTGMPAVGGNRVELLGITEEFVDRLVEDIDAATRHVHLEFYIYANDETGRRIADTLVRAVERGVCCRLLVDAVGSKRMLRRLAPELRQKGVEVHAMLPVHLLRLVVARLDLRNHRKLAVIDGEIAYAGSQNVVNEDYGRRNLVWHDIMVRVTGPVIHSLQAVFLADFYTSRDEVVEDESVFPALGTPGNTVLQALPSGPNYPTESYQRMVAAAIHAARRGIIITTPYFVPDEATFQALQVAVLRGVDVDIIMPRRSDQILVGAASRAYYEPLLEAGVRVHLYDRGLLHAKTISIDDAIAFIGSSNFDIRSFALNFELNLALYGPEVTRALREKQRRYLNDAGQLDLADWKQRAWHREMTQRLAALLSPLL